MIRIGWAITGVATVGLTAYAIYWGRVAGGPGFLFAAFSAALVIIGIWFVMLVLSVIETGSRVRREMREERTGSSDT